MKVIKIDSASRESFAFRSLPARRLHPWRDRSCLTTADFSNSIERKYSVKGTNLRSYSKLDFISDN
jgi:hypothetical protein